MNTIAAIMLSIWLAGWTVALVRAGLKARVARAPVAVPRGVPVAYGLKSRCF
jgi:hypothetical protein